MKKEIKWLLIGLLIMLSSIIGAYKFVNGYLVKMTWNEDGTGQGSMREPDLIDSLMFLGLIALAIVGFIILLFNLTKYFRKRKA